MRGTDVNYNGVLEQEDFDVFLTTSRDPEMQNNDREDESELNFDPIPTTNIGDFALYISKETSYFRMNLSGNLILNQCGTFYRAVVHTILLYGSETWVLSAAMERKAEVMNIGLIGQIKGKRARRLGDRAWETPIAEEVQEAVGTQSDMTYIGRQKATMTQWVALRPLFEVCARDKGYEGGRRRGKAWWHQEAT